LESFAFLAIFFPRLPILIGLGLIVFHSFVDVSFDFDFRTNVVLIGLFFFPIFDSLRSRRGHGDPGMESCQPELGEEQAGPSGQPLPAA